MSANIDYEVTIAEECQSWLKPAPKTRAETVTTTHSFVADYYENDSGADRKGSITFSNRPYGITVTLGVRQSPVVPDTPTEPGIATAQTSWPLPRPSTPAEARIVGRTLRERWCCSTTSI